MQRLMVERVSMLSILTGLDQASINDLNDEQVGGWVGRCGGILKQELILRSVLIPMF